jgi:hypothetical protein
MKGSYYLKNNNLTVRQKLPATILMGLKGRKLGQVIAHDWLPPDAIIAQAVVNRNGTKLTLKVAKVPFSLDEDDRNLD